MKILKANVNGLLLMGWKFQGTPVATIINGQIKMKNGKILGNPEGKTLLFNV